MGPNKENTSIYINNTKDVNSYVCRNSAFISSMKIHVYVCANLVSIAVLDICTVEPKVVILQFDITGFHEHHKAFYGSSETNTLSPIW